MSFIWHVIKTFIVMFLVSYLVVSNAIPLAQVAFAQGNAVPSSGSTEGYNHPWIFFYSGDQAGTFANWISADLGLKAGSESFSAGGVVNPDYNFFTNSDVEYPVGTPVSDQGIWYGCQHYNLPTGSRVYFRENKEAIPTGTINGITNNATGCILTIEGASDNGTAFLPSQGVNIASGHRAMVLNLFLDQQSSTFLSSNIISNACRIIPEKFREVHGGYFNFVSSSRANWYVNEQFQDPLPRDQDGNLTGFNSVQVSCIYEYDTSVYGSASPIIQYSYTDEDGYSRISLFSDDQPTGGTLRTPSFSAPSTPTPPTNPLPTPEPPLPPPPLPAVGNIGIDQSLTTATSLVFTWNSVVGAVNYEVYLGRQGQSISQVLQTDPTLTLFNRISFGSLTPSTEYRVVIRAKAPQTESPLSFSAWFSTSGADPQETSLPEYVEETDQRLQTIDGIISEDSPNIFVRTDTGDKDGTIEDIFFTCWRREGVLGSRATYLYTKDDLEDGTYTIKKEGLGGVFNIQRYAYIFFYGSCNSWHFLGETTGEFQNRLPIAWGYRPLRQIYDGYRSTAGGEYSSPDGVGLCLSQTHEAVSAENDFCLNPISFIDSAINGLASLTDSFEDETISQIEDLIRLALWGFLALVGFRIIFNKLRKHDDD